MDKQELIKLLEKEGFLKSQKIEKAFRKVNRENFVPEELKHRAYENYPLPIGNGQTISQPLTVVAMTGALDVKEDMKILEVGTGSGYQAAILSELVGKNGKVITIEIIKELYDFAKKNLKNYKNVKIIFGDGSQGYEKEKPYNRIMVTADCPEVPKPLKTQLGKEGKMVIPVQSSLTLVEKNNKIEESYLGPFVFVPLKGKYGYE